MYYNKKIEIVYRYKIHYLVNMQHLASNMDIH